MQLRRPFQRSLTIGLLALALLAATAFAKAPEFALPLAPDQGVYTYVGQLVLAGQAPYRDVWENKPPGVYLVYAAVIGLSQDPWVACPIKEVPYWCGHLLLQSFDLVYALVLAVAVFGAARLLRLPWQLAFFASLLCAVFADQALLSHAGATPEKLMLLPITLSFTSYLAFESSGKRRWLLLSGLLAGLGFLFKQPGVMILGALALARLLRLRPWHFRARQPQYLKELALLATAAAIPAAIAATYLALLGALGDFVDQALIFNLRYASADSDRLLWNFAASLWRNFNQAAGLLWLYATAGAVVLLLHQPSLDRHFLLLAWALSDILSLFLGGSKFGDRYYVQLVPSFSLLGAVGIHSLLRATGQHTNWRSIFRDPLRAWLVSVSLAVLLLSTPFQARVAMRAWNDRFAHGLAMTPGELVSGLARTGEGTLFIWGYAANAYVLAETRPATKYIHHVPLSQHYALDPNFRDRRARLLQDLKERPPELIGIAPSTSEQDPTGSRFLNISSFPELQAFLSQHYVEIDSDDTPGWRLFRLASARVS